MQSISQIRLPCDRSAESPDCKTDCIVYAQKIIQSASWQAIARQTKKYLAVLDILCRLYNQLLPEPTILGYQSLKNFNLTSKSCSASNFNAEKYQIPNTIDLCRDYNFFCKGARCRCHNPFSNSSENHQDITVAPLAKWCDFALRHCFTHSVRLRLLLFLTTTEIAIAAKATFSSDDMLSNEHARTHGGHVADCISVCARDCKCDLCNLPADGSVK